MRYIEFKELIRKTLIEHPDGLTWKELRVRLELPYKTPCPEWVRRLENEIDLIRVKDFGRALSWKINQEI